MKMVDKKNEEFDIHREDEINPEPDFKKNIYPKNFKISAEKVDRLLEETLLGTGNPEDSRTHNALKEFLKKNDFSNFKGELAGLKPREAPTMENLSWDYIAEEGYSDLSTLDRVNDMIINAQAYLKNGDYDNARRQLEILQSINLPLYLDGDSETQEKVRGIIADLSR